MDFALNNLRRLIYHKAQTNKQSNIFSHSLRAILEIVKASLILYIEMFRHSIHPSRQDLIANV